MIEVIVILTFMSVFLIVIGQTNNKEIVKETGIVSFWIIVILGWIVCGFLWEMNKKSVIISQPLIEKQKNVSTEPK